ncbi:hypothetical protein HDV06_004892 [Boothiomyces sp. JEL0866]|nr:hypothetical protein HDV06_004892 [Boothiomyces sp. JEL0866]
MIHLLFTFALGQYTESPGCDFQNQGDFQHVNVPETQCGSTCLSTTSCSHYTWVPDYGGTCWMKNGITPNSSPSSAAGIICGYLTSSAPFTQRAGCDFQNQGDLAHVSTSLANCGPTCQSTAGCTHFAWVTDNGGTCWMKSGPVSWNNAQSSSTAGIFCGILNQGPVVTTTTTVPVVTSLPLTTTTLSPSTTTSIAPTPTFTERPGCDFKGQGDFQHVTNLAENQCGPVCVKTDLCTHYTWVTDSGGTCWMKTGNATLSDSTPSSTAGIYCGAVLNKPAPTPLTRLLTPDQMSAFAKASGTQVTLNGKPFFFGSSNIYRLFYTLSSDLPTYFSDAITARSSNGQLVFNDDVSSGLGRMDVVLHQANQAGIKLILTLANNWGDFGGIDFYVNSFSTNNPKSHSDFYKNAAVKTQFKRWLNHVLTRVNSITGVAYKDDPTIFAWELGNEFRCVGSGPLPPGSCSPNDITSWIDEMSGYIKSIDSNHMVAIGDEGFFNSGHFSGGYSGNPYGDLFNGVNDFERNAGLSHIDILSFHAYFDQWNTPNEPQKLQNSLQWIRDHNSVSKNVNKPIYLGEYGIGNIQDKLNDFPQMQGLVQDLGMAGSLMWLLQSTENGQPCQETADSAGRTYGLCVSDPNAYTVLINHGNYMFQKSNQ